MNSIDLQPFNQLGALPRGLNPHRLLDLRQMLEVSATDYLRIGSAMQSFCDTLAVDIGLDEPLNKAALDSIQKSLREILRCSEELNLTVCVKLVSRRHEAYKSAAPSYRQAGEAIRAIQEAFDVELQSRTFFFVPYEWAKYHSVWVLPLSSLGDKMEGFAPVIKQFPSADEDIREAGNCLAFDRGTACVFHLMRVVEAGLKVTAKALGVAYTTDWGRCFRDIEKQGEQSDPFFKEAIAYLRSIKNVWRNPTMHIERIYSQPEAERILKAVEAFMAHLATRLTE